MIKRILVATVLSGAPVLGFAQPTIHTCVWPNVCSAVVSGPIITTCVWPHPCKA